MREAEAGEEANFLRSGHKSNRVIKSWLKNGKFYTRDLTLYCVLFHESKRSRGYGGI